MSIFDLYFSNFACKYAQHGVSERECSVCYELKHADFHLHIALTQKRQISDSRAFILRADHLYILDSFKVMIQKKKERNEQTNKESKKEKF